MFILISNSYVVNTVSEGPCPFVFLIGALLYQSHKVWPLSIGSSEGLYEMLMSAVVAL